jgi:hypothetical protein
MLQLVGASSKRQSNAQIYYHPRRFLKLFRSIMFVFISGQSERLELVERRKAPMSSIKIKGFCIEFTVFYSCYSNHSWTMFFFLYSSVLLTSTAGMTFKSFLPPVAGHSWSCIIFPLAQYFFQNMGLFNTCQFLVKTLKRNAQSIAV